MAGLRPIPRKPSIFAYQSTDKVLFTLFNICYMILHAYINSCLQKFKPFRYMYIIIHIFIESASTFEKKILKPSQRNNGIRHWKLGVQTKEKMLIA